MNTAPPQTLPKGNRGGGRPSYLLCAAPVRDATADSATRRARARGPWARLRGRPQQDSD